MKKFLIMTAFLAAAAFTAISLPAQEKKPAPPAAKPAPPPPNRGAIINRLKNENPYKQIKVGEQASFPLASGAEVKGNIIKITEKGVWLKDGVASQLLKWNVISQEGRARFSRKEYDKYINTLADQEIRGIVGVNFSGNTKNAAKPGDPRFKKPTKAPSTSVGKGKSPTLGGD